MTTSRSLLWNDTNYGDTDDAAIHEDISGVQVAFSSTVTILFIVMIFLSGVFRATRPRSVVPPSRIQRSLEDRKKLVTNSLVVKYVVRREPTLDDSPGAPSALQPLDPMDEVELVTRHIQRQASCTSISQSVRRTKSNLILTNAMEQESSFESSSGRRPACAICLTPYEIGDEISWSPNPECQHVFHHKCIAHWLYKHDDCPMCRANFLGLSISTAPQQRMTRTNRPTIEATTPPVDIEAPPAAGSSDVIASNET